MAHFRAFGLQLFKDSIDVTDADVSPTSHMNLVTFAQEKMAANTRNRSESSYYPPVVLEPQHLSVVLHAGNDIADSNNRCEALELDRRRGVARRHCQSSLTIPRDANVY